MADQRVGKPYEERRVGGLGATCFLAVFLVVMAHAKDLAGVRDHWQQRDPLERNGPPRGGAGLGEPGQRILLQHRLQVYVPGIRIDEDPVVLQYAAGCSAIMDKGNETHGNSSECSCSGAD